MEIFKKHELRLPRQEVALHRRLAGADGGRAWSAWSSRAACATESTSRAARSSTVKFAGPPPVEKIRSSCSKPRSPAKSRSRSIVHGRNRGGHRHRAEAATRNLHASAATIIAEALDGDLRAVRRRKLDFNNAERAGCSRTGLRDPLIRAGVGLTEHAAAGSGATRMLAFREHAAPLGSVSSLSMSLPPCSGRDARGHQAF